MAVIGPFERRIKYICLSTDTKPTEGIPIGAELYETDTQKTYLFTGTMWVEE